MYEVTKVLVSDSPCRIVHVVVMSCKNHFRFILAQRIFSSLLLFRSVGNKT